MNVQPAIDRQLATAKQRFRLPPRVPPFNPATHAIFTAVWTVVLLIAVFGPSLALYDRYRTPSENSQLLLGSRAGFAASLTDATEVRYLVGPAAREAGLRKGDDIVAIFGLPLPEVMPMSDTAIEANADNPAYIAMSTLLYGTDEMPVPLTVRSTDGIIRDVTVETSETHINDAARERGFSPTLLNFIDVVHVIFYPFLIWAAWILHRRNSRDAVSSVLSLAILLTIATELPSSAFLAAQGVPRAILVGAYDLGNMMLLAGILLFPHGRLTPVVAGLLAATPLLMLLSGQAYQACFLGILLAAVLVQIRSMRTAESSDVRQQIRWALFGFSGYALFKTLAYAADLFKWSAGSFTTQLSLEVFAGFSFGFSILIFQLGLLIALIRYRLYDAEAVISRTATAAILTFGIGGTFAAVMEGIITSAQFIYPDSEASQTIAAMGGAVMAAVVIEPLHRRTREWAERQFHKALLEIREDLPERMRDTRDSATLDEFLDYVLKRVLAGLLSVRGAILFNGRVEHAVGIQEADVLRWYEEHRPEQDDHVLDCEPTDHVFPLRFEVETSAGAFGWILIGPRPDGTIPGKDEQKALKHIAPTLGRSMRIVLTRQEERAEVLHLIGEQAERITQLERLLQKKT
ncbi:hypothetical protein H8M03_04735 [Sphingomonas sabuli]|uniref:PDZ domain-containing protein n=1 Tax=Sphingomonas sabuli TaxID=2764186 RepID=A0A7G9L4T6_9SPHN|nr:hypothetical protein [Sphingomonas sabuli]QNM83635.1 hypothetical protein H8M03_04735 [Sphingomonas sabuli]